MLNLRMLRRSKIVYHYWRNGQKNRFYLNKYSVTIITPSLDPLKEVG